MTWRHCLIDKHDTYSRQPGEGWVKDDTEWGVNNNKMNTLIEITLYSCIQKGGKESKRTTTTINQHWEQVNKLIGYEICKKKNMHIHIPSHYSWAPNSFSIHTHSPGCCAVPCPHLQPLLLLLSLWPGWSQHCESGYAGFSPHSLHWMIAGI